MSAGFCGSVAARDPAEQEPGTSAFWRIMSAFRPAADLGALSSVQLVVDPKEKCGVPEETKLWSLTALREKLIKIGAKVVRHGRYVTFQLAEVAVPRALFADILRLIRVLQPRPAPK